jgi:hypothetical protein
MKAQVTSIEQSHRLLELKDIAGYLPYGLNYQWTNMKSVRLISMTDEVDYGSQHSLSTAWEWMKHGQARPILRPMSDLTKEITHRGETFVPMVEIGKLLGYDNLKKYEIDGVVEYGFETRYADDAQGYIFGWHQASQSFGIWYDEIDEDLPSVERLVMNVCAFDKLSEWMFDYRGLIPVGLAVDVNTLSENPYEV